MVVSLTNKIQSSIQIHVLYVTHGTHVMECYVAYVTVSHAGFCINHHYVVMVVLMRFKYGTSGKATFVLCSDKFGFTLLPCLVIDLNSVIKA